MSDGDDDIPTGHDHDVNDDGIDLSDLLPSSDRRTDKDTIEHTDVDPMADTFQTAGAPQPAAKKTYSLLDLFPEIGPTFSKDSMKKDSIGDGARWLATRMKLASPEIGPEDIARLVLYRGLPIRERRNEADVPVADIERLLEGTSARLSAKDEGTVSLHTHLKYISLLDRGLMNEIVRIGLMGAIWHGLRSKGTIEGHPAYDTLSWVQDVGYVIALGDVLYQMGSMHAAYKEPLSETASDLLRNPYLQQQVLLTGATWVLPRLADLANTEDPLGAFKKKYIDRFEEAFSGKDTGKEYGTLTGAVKQLQKIAPGVAGPVASAAKGLFDSQAQSIIDVVKAASDESQDQGSVLFNGLKNIVGEAFNDDLGRIERASAAALRILETGLISCGLPVLNITQAITYDTAQLVLQHEGKKLGLERYVR